MTILGFPVPYADVTYADLINLAEPWLSADDTDKENALQLARVYIDVSYNILFDIDDPSDTVKTANSILADSELSIPLFDAALTGAPQRGLTEQSTGAGSAKTKKTWNAHLSNNFVDPFPEVTALLLQSGDATLKKGGIQTTTLIRR